MLNLSILGMSFAIIGYGVTTILLDYGVQDVSSLFIGSAVFFLGLLNAYGDYEKGKEVR